VKEEAVKWYGLLHELSFQQIDPLRKEEWRSQLRFVIEFVQETPSMQLRILPTNASLLGAHFSFTLFDYTVACFEGVYSAVTRWEDDQVKAYHYFFEYLWTKALDQKQSIEYIEKLLK
jgi:hypothetical protein